MRQRLHDGTDDAHVDLIIGDVRQVNGIDDPFQFFPDRIRQGGLIEQQDGFVPMVTEPPEKLQNLDLVARGGRVGHDMGDQDHRGSLVVSIRRHGFSLGFDSVSALR
ncbi:MAG: hypothetical protein HPY67_13540 [Syntrophaceae bacterium]|nr:hypothetical protein [Syntrophaceae bacterium]